MKVYLAGPINGCTDAEARGWRETAKRDLVGVEFLDPMVRDYRGAEDANVDAVVRGDLADIERCDTLLVNAARPSWGTAMEVRHAWTLTKRVVAVCPGTVSPWLRFHSTVVFPSFAEAFVYLRQCATWEARCA